MAAVGASVSKRLEQCTFPQRKQTAPIPEFTERKQSPPIDTFYSNTDSAPITLTDAQKEQAMNIVVPNFKMDALDPLVHASLTFERYRIRMAREKEGLANIRKKDMVLIARKRFHESEKLSLH